jgi:hypothetical protein
MGERKHLARFALLAALALSTSVTARAEPTHAPCPAFGVRDPWRESESGPGASWECVSQTPGDSASHPASDSTRVLNYLITEVVDPWPERKPRMDWQAGTWLPTNLSSLEIVDPWHAPAAAALPLARNEAIESPLAPQTTTTLPASGL